MQRYLVACLSVIITAALAVVPFASSASALETKIALNAENFPDPAFRDYIANLFDVDKNGYLDQEECDDITEIEGSWWSSLVGIAFFPNLKYLKIYNSSITELNLSKNKKLSYIFIGSSNLTELDLTSNVALSTLSIENNGDFQKLMLANNGALNYLWVGGTGLTSLEWPNNNHVSYLDISETPMLAASLPDGTFGDSEKVYPLKAKEIQYNPFEGSFDLKKLVPWFDGSKVSNVRGATMNGSVVSGLKGKVTVRYNYATGRGDIKPVIVFTPQVLPQSVDQVKVTVTEGQQPALPSSVNVRYTDGSVKVVPVTWDAHDWAAQKPGTVTLSGTVSGTSLRATAVVTVTQRPYNVTFDSNGGTAVSSAAVEAGQKVAEPAAPTRTGYTFAGWYTAKGGGSKYDFTKPVTADMTLYARWTVNKYTVAFDANGGSAVKSATVEHGKTVVKPADPTRTNYTFTGWYTAKSGGAKFDFAKPITSNVTVFAQWQPRIVFRDVSATTPHREDIIWLADNGISTGWLMPDGTYEFRGMDTVKRQDMAAFLRRLAAKYGIAGAKDFKPVAADWKRFKDVNSKTPHAEDILWLAKSGISTGWQETDGSWTFRGMDTVKRQDMAAFLYRLADKAGTAGGVRPKTDFTDVTAKTPHYKDVEWLGGSGISQGYRNANGTWRFEGMTSVYRQDMAAFLHRLNERLTK